MHTFLGRTIMSEHGIISGAHDISYKHINSRPDISKNFFYLPHWRAITDSLLFVQALNLLYMTVTTNEILAHFSNDAKVKLRHKRVCSYNDFFNINYKPKYLNNKKKSYFNHACRPIALRMREEFLHPVFGQWCIVCVCNESIYGLDLKFVRD